MAHCTKTRAAMGGILLAALLFLAQPGLGLAGDFLAGTEDVPVMPGLVEAPGAVIFDTPSGRIIEAFAEGRADPRDVLTFYAETLPQLGWRSQVKAGGPISFSREDEILTLDVVENSEKLVLRFTVAPR